MLTFWVIETYVEVISKNICIFFQNLSWHTRALACFWRVKNSLSTCEKKKKGWSFPSHAFPVACMMGWFLYYTVHLMIECAVLSDSRSLMESWWIVRLLTIFEKMFKTGWYFIITRNDFRIIYRCNFLRGHHFVRQKWFYRFPKHFLMSHVFFEMF